MPRKQSRKASEFYRAGQILLIDWRGDALPKEANKLRPCIVVEDDGLFSPIYPNVVVVPLTEDAQVFIPELSVKIMPSAENGRTKPCFAVAHAVITASKQRIVEVTPHMVTPGQFQEIRARIAECIGFTSK